MQEIAGVNTSQMLQTALNEVKDAFPSLKATERVDLSGAITSKLAFIVMRFQTALENMAALGIKEQEAVDARIKALSEVLNAVQKLEVGQFSKADLDKVLDLSAVPPSMEAAIADIKEQAKEKYDLAVAAAKLAERKSCAEVEDWAYRKTSGFKSNYEQMLKIIEPSEVVSTEDGMLRYWGVARSTGETAYINIPIHGTLFYPTWATDIVRLWDIRQRRQFTHTLPKRSQRRYWAVYTIPMKPPIFQRQAMEILFRKALPPFTILQKKSRTWSKSCRPR